MDFKLIFKAFIHPFITPLLSLSLFLFLSLSLSLSLTGQISICCDLQFLPFIVIVRQVLLPSSSLLELRQKHDSVLLSEVGG